MSTSPWMNEELSILKDSLPKLLRTEFLPHRDQWEDVGMVSREAWLKAGEAGIICPSLPVEYGGSGGSRAFDAVVAEEFERAQLGGGFGVGIGVQSMVAHYILAYGSEEQKMKWLPRMASGDLIAAMAMSEPGTGSDLQAVSTTAKRVGDEYSISGQKVFISNGQTAELIMAVCKTGEGDQQGVSLVMVETDREGFRRGRNLKKIGLQAQDTSELFFDEVKVPLSNLLGKKEGEGFRQLMEQLDWERMMCALGGVITMELAVEYTSDYVKERKVFGQPVMSFQNTQFKLAECKTLATIARTFFDQMLIKYLDGTIKPTEVAMAKWWISENQGKVIDECLQLYGGYGYMLEYPIARLWRDARVQRIYAGTNEIMKVIIARSL